MNVIIVGAGVMGLSVARALHRGGATVTVYEQHQIPNPMGASVDAHRLIRYPYGTHPGYGRMIGEAYQAWERLWKDLGVTLYHETGTLVCCRTDDGWGMAAAGALEADGHPIQWLTPEALRHACPVLNADGIRRAYRLSSGGVLLADQIVGHLARWLADQGVTLHAQQPVVKADPAAARITLADGTTHRADALILAAGAWTGRLLPTLKPRLTPSRQLVIYLDPPATDRAFWSTGPMVLDVDHESGFYLVPPVANTGLKVGDHRFSMTGEPDEDRTPTEAEVATMVRFAANRFTNGAGYQCRQVKACYYSVTSDEAFIVERQGRTWVLAGFSGHGFKFSAALGERVAQHLLQGPSAADDALTRWAAGAA